MTLTRSKAGATRIAAADSWYATEEEIISAIDSDPSTPDTWTN